MKSCFIYCAGEHYDSYLAPKNGDMTVAVDGGYETMLRLGVAPKLVVGDFDSLGYVPQNIEIVKHPAIKDDTDTALACKLMTERGYGRLYLHGVFGKRLDHSVANIQLMKSLSESGAEVFAFDNGYTAAVITNSSLSFSSEYKGTVSAFSVTDVSSGVSEQSLKYTLDKVTLTSDTPLGVSNEFTGSCAKITVESGSQLVMFERRSILPLPDITHF